MNVGELKRKMEGIDDDTYIVVSHESDKGTALFEVMDVAPAKGKPVRNEFTRKAGFAFDQNGPAYWLFISTEEA
jgi:hypothetical protein